MSDIRAKAPDGYFKDVRMSKNANLLLVTGKQVKAITTKILAATTNYAAEDVLADSGSTVWKFRVVEENGGGGKIIQAQAYLSTTGLDPGITLYLFEIAPTSALIDNAANTAVLAADLLYHIGNIDFMAMSDLGGHSEAMVTESTVGGLSIKFQLDTGRDIYGIAVTRAAITGEAANMKLTFKMVVEQY